MALPSSSSLFRLPSDTPSLSALSRYVVSSPYTDDDHLLDLQTLDTENQLLARALQKMDCTRDDYATAPYIDSFNFSECIAELKQLAKEHDHVWRQSTFYIVAFRSQIPPTTLYSELGELDKAAHREAVESGGLLKCVVIPFHWAKQPWAKH